MVQSPNAANIAIAFARSHIGDPYVFGATGPDTWDCSGLVMKAYASAGVILPRTTGQMINSGTAVAQADLQIGDLVFPDYHHVQIYTGGGKIIEAPQTGEVVVERNMWGFWRARRVVSTPGTAVSAGGAVQGFGNPVTGTLDTAKAVVDALSSTAKWVTNADNWLRVAELIAGALLILVALFSLNSVKGAVKGAVNAGIS